MIVSEFRVIPNIRLRSARPVTAVMHALSDDTRLAIVQILRAEEVLREAGLVEQENRGTQRWTTLRAAEFEDRFPGLRNAVAAPFGGGSAQR